MFAFVPLSKLSQCFFSRSFCDSVLPVLEKEIVSSVVGLGMEELERLLASNEDFSITIDDKKLPEIPFNYVQPSNNTPRPNNTPPFNNTSQPNNTPPFNNTPPPALPTIPTEMSVISVRNAESLNANSNE
ncbi:unnamed protein product [Rhizophagus irregularis]|nr:unnamed protein product [Rhizophagus irregularis]